MTEQWRHIKRGTVYEIIADHAALQCATAPQFEELFDDAAWTVYRNVKTGMIYIRLTDEFLDGRFVKENE